MPWSTNVEIPNQSSKAPPALAELGDNLHMVHLDNSSNDIWHSSFNKTIKKWTTNVRIPNQRSKAAPALAALDGALHMVHLGDSSNDIWHSSYVLSSGFGGSHWTPNVKIPDQSSRAAPALAAFDGRLHMVHLGDNSNELWHSIYSGLKWSTNVKIPRQMSKASPALAAFDGFLHMVHLDDSSDDIWYSTYNGSSWTLDVKIPDQKSKAAPALAVYRDVCGRNQLAMVHLGESSNAIWYSQLEGSAWSRNYFIFDQLSKASPALGSLDSGLHMVHLGDSTNDLWHSSTNGLKYWVRVGIKTLFNPTDFTIDDMLSDMASVFATVNFQVVEVGFEKLNLPSLETVEIGDCLSSQLTPEQNALFAHRQGLRSQDVAAYFVKATLPAVDGCAAHPNGIPACIVVGDAGRWTLAHEVGHVLGLSHANDTHNLMTPREYTDPPPILTAAQGTTMQGNLPQAWHC